MRHVVLICALSSVAAGQPPQRPDTLKSANGNVSVVSGDTLTMMKPGQAAAVFLVGPKVVLRLRGTVRDTVPESLAPFIRTLAKEVVFYNSRFKNP